MMQWQTGDWFAAGRCAHCGDAFVAIQRETLSADRFCSPRCGKHASAKAARHRRAREQAEQARARRLQARDKPGVHDLHQHRRIRCGDCGKLAFPTLERAMFAACLFSASLCVRIVPYYLHDHWHVTTRRNHRQGRGARARNRRARKALRRGHKTPA